MLLKAVRRRLILSILALAFVVLVFLYWQERIGVELPGESEDTNVARHETVAIFGGSGRAGDGLLKSVMNDPDVMKIHVITRRTTPRMDAGVQSGKVVTTTHLDYLDYSAIRGILEDVDAVYWALGVASKWKGSDEEYRVIHVDFPISFVQEWLYARKDSEISFHYISGSRVDVESESLSRRTKGFAEIELFKLADGTNLRVIVYRPSWIIPTKEQSHIGYDLFEAVNTPIDNAIRATIIGQAMLEVTARGNQIANGRILENRDILKYGNGYRERRTREPDVGKVSRIRVDF